MNINNYSANEMYLKITDPAGPLFHYQTVQTQKGLMDQCKNCRMFCAEGTNGSVQKVEKVEKVLWFTVKRYAGQARTGPGSTLRLQNS